MNKNSYLSIGLFLVQCFYILSYSQSYDNNWLVGYGITDDKKKPFYGLSLIGFSTDTLSINYIADKTIPDLLYDFDYSCISDSRGVFRYFTNGCKILNKKYQVMQNGDSINPGPIWEGSKGTYYPLVNGTMFLPDPGDSNKYYLFHKGSFQGGTPAFGYLASNVLYYSLIDARLDNGLGSVIEKNVIVLSDTINESQMAACRHANGRDWWIPIRHGDKNLYYMYLLGPNGVHLDHTQYIGLNGPGHDDTFNGNSCFSPDGTKYASCLREDFIQLFEFDRCSGIFSNPMHITSVVKDTNSFFSYASCVCFSPNSRFLYFNDNYRLIQYDLSVNNIKKSEELIAVWDTFIYNNSFPTAFFQTRLAPDDKIYMSMFGGSNIYLHRINSPNAKGKTCNFIQRDIELPNRHSGILPYFPNFKLGPQIGSACDSIYSVDLSIDLYIGPNPVYDEMKIVLAKEYKFSELAQFELYTIDGKIILNELLLLSSLETKIKLHSLASGLYFYKLNSNSNQWSKSGKLIVIH